MSDELEQPLSEDSGLPELPESDEGTEVELTESEGDEALDEEQAPEPDEEEVEYEGKQYKLPKELKDALLRQADYTRKTQEVAEIRRTVEAEQQRFQAERQLHQQSIQEVARIYAIDSQLEQFAQIDWNALSDTDPVQAMKLDRQARELQAQRAQAVQAITQRQAELEQRQQQEAARQRAEGLRVLQREIPGWGDQMARELIEFGRSRGYSEQMLMSITDPQMIKDLYELKQYAELRKKATAKPQPVQEKPVTRITASKAKGTVDPDKMSPDQWLKWRNAQIKKSR